MDADQLFTVAFVDKEVHFFGPKEYDENRFQQLIQSLLEQCGLSAYEEELKLAGESGVAHLITWRDVEKHLPALLTNYGFVQITKVWAAVSFYPCLHEVDGAPKVLGRAKELIDKYNSIARESYGIKKDDKERGNSASTSGA